MKWLLLVLVLSSCAQQRILLDEKNVIPFKDFTAKTPLTTSKVFSIQNITDSRKDISAIGVGRTGVNYTETPFVLNRDIASYLKDVFEKGFTDRGIKVGDNGDVLLDLVVNDLWVSELIEKHKLERAHCKVNMTIYSKIDNTTWSGNYWTEITSPGDLGDATEKLPSTFASCLNMIVEKFVKDQSFQALVK